MTKRQPKSNQVQGVKPKRYGVGKGHFEFQAKTSVEGERGTQSMFLRRVKPPEAPCPWSWRVGVSLLGSATATSENGRDSLERQAPISFHQFRKPVGQSDCAAPGIGNAVDPGQGFSSAARGRNNHPDLWPEWFRLISATLPPRVFGEQVAQSGGWIDRVCSDLEGVDHEVWAGILQAVAVGKDHARPRIYFESHANGDRKSVLPVDAETPRMPGDNCEPRKLVPAHGVPSRVAVMRAFGNAIVPQLAAEFIKAAM